MNIIMATSEVQPFIKNGDYCDTVYNLSKNLVDKCNISVFVPASKLILTYDIKKSKYIGIVNVYYNNHYYLTPLYLYVYENINYYFVLNDSYFNRNNIYGYDDDIERFAFFSVAILTIIKKYNMCVDILHAHDYTCSIIGYLHKRYYGDIEMKTLFTIHKLSNSTIKGIDNNEISCFNSKIYIDHHFRINDDMVCKYPLLYYFDNVNTVSKSFAKELTTNELSKDLKNIINLLDKKIIGILNSVDEIKYNPDTSDYVMYNYNNRNYIDNKKKNKKYIQRELGLEVNDNKMLIVINSKITWEKGMCLVVDVIDKIIANKDIQLIIIGNGSTELTTKLEEYTNEDNFYFYYGYDSELKQKVYSGSDLIIQPSLIEPFGKNVVIAKKFGVVPYVRNSGGLKDLVISIEENCKLANGFKFEEFDSNEFYNGLENVIDIYKNKNELFAKLTNNCMNDSYSWIDASKEYIINYKEILAKDT